MIVTVSQLETQLWVELEHFPRDLLTRIGLRFHFDRRVERPSLSPHLSSVRSRSVVPSNSPWSSSFARLTSFPTITHRCNNAVCSRSPNLGSGLVLRKVELACSLVLFMVLLQNFTWYIYILRSFESSYESPMTRVHLFLGFDSIHLCGQSLPSSSVEMSER